MGGDHLLAATGPLGVVPLRAVPLPALVDLPEAARRAADRGWTRDSRLARHVELLRGRGPAWLALTGGAGSGELLPRLAHAARTVSWWDRLADDGAAQEVFAASARAAAAAVPHRVLGLREDVDGSVGEPGRSARQAAQDALTATWSARAAGPEAEQPLPLGDALDRSLPRDAVLWLGSRPRPPRALGAPAGPADACCRPGTVDLVQGVRPVALPLSDRLLSLLPR